MHIYLRICMCIFLRRKLTRAGKIRSNFALNSFQFHNSVSTLNDSISILLTQQPATAIAIAIAIAAQHITHTTQISLNCPNYVYAAYATCTQLSNALSLRLLVEAVAVSAKSIRQSY